MVLVVAFESEATIPSLWKRKVVMPDANVTSFGSIPISALIKNVDMEDLIKVYQLAKKHNPVYSHIQEFLTRVSLYILSCFIFIIDSLIMQFMSNGMLVIVVANMRLFNVIRMGHTILVTSPPLPKDIHGLICSLQMSQRTSRFLESPIFGPHFEYALG